MSANVKLYEYNKTEWRDILQKVVCIKGGTWSEEKFEKDWNEFVKLKVRKQIQ